jgi:hypothetical protein
VTDTDVGQESSAAHGAGIVAPSSLRRHLWLIVFGAGATAWLAAAVVTEVTEDTILVPNVIILGSFLVPVCVLLFVMGRPREAHLRLETLLLGFLAGGTIGLVFSAGIEIWLLPDRIGTNLGIGLIESVDQRSVISILETEMNRAILAPFGHLTWTALIGGALFASAWSSGRFRIDRRVVWTFVGVMALHGLWDSSDSFAIWLSQGLGGEGWSLGWPDTADWVGTPTGADLIRFDVIYTVLVGINAIIGVTWAIRRWRAYQIDRWTAEHAAAQR